MHLTQEEEDILNGERGRGMQKAMELLAAIGDIYDADKLIPIKSVQVAGVSYKTIGDAGLEFVKDFSKECKVSVKTTLNPIGMDMELWKEMDIDEEFARRQMAIVRAYADMDIEVSCSCTPYLVGNRPEFGDHLAWSESSAVSFANSVIGARTNREGGPSALAAAIIGKTPSYGLHLDENRRADVIVNVDMEGKVDYASLGCHVGRAVKNRIPYFRGISPTEDEMKTLGAAMAATGSVALYHVEGTTPEADSVIPDNCRPENITVEKNDLDEIKNELNTAELPELVAVGCPHCSLDEIKRIAGLLKGRTNKKDVELWVCTSRAVKEQAEEYVSIIEEFGGMVLSDTCMVVTPIERMYKSTGTDSGKAAVYLPLPTFCGQRVRFADIEQLVEMIT